VTKDQVQYTGTIAAIGQEVLEWDCRALTIELDGTDVFDNAGFVQPTNLWWFLLEPGDNDIRISHSAPGGVQDFSFSWFEAWL
jgi:Phage tail protein.